jgi:hypothetical protein
MILLYIDPGSGSLLLQALIASFLTFITYFKRIKLFFLTFFRKFKKDISTNESNKS